MGTVMRKPVRARFLRGLLPVVDHGPAVPVVDSKAPGGAQVQAAVRTPLRHPAAVRTKGEPVAAV